MRADQRYGTIPKLLLAAADRWGGRPAIVDGSVTVGFAELADEVVAFSAALLDGGVQPGDRVGLWAPNSWAWIAAAIGIQGAGAWLVPLNTRFKGLEVAEVLRRAGASAVVVVDDFLGLDYEQQLRAADPSSPALQLVVRMPAPGVPPTEEWCSFLAQGAGREGAARDRIAAGTADDTSDLIFTSGTTGYPKGVLLRQGTSLRAYEGLNTGYGLGEGDQHLTTTPFFHCFGYKAGWMLSLLVGATTHPMAVFDAGGALNAIQAHRITHMPGAPTIFDALLHHPARRSTDLSSLQVAMVAAANIPPELPRRMATDLGFRVVMSGYGLTENHALGTFTRPDDPPEVVASTVGRAAPDIEIRIVDDKGRTVPAGATGEVLLGGYAQMSGYYHDPAATAEAIRDGWLYTGDVGHLDDNGNLHITDRKKDLFIVGGFNVAPAEVEAALLRLEGVAQVAVVGMPDPHFGEVGAAFVVPAEGSDLTSDLVLSYARRVLANYKVPRRVTLVDELPLNATGKVLKHMLREQLHHTTSATL